MNYPSIKIEFDNDATHDISIDCTHIQCRDCTFAEQHDRCQLSHTRTTEDIVALCVALGRSLESKIEEET